MDSVGIEGLEIRQLVPGDVPALIACVRACYGESYPDPQFYDETALHAELDSSRLFAIGAFDDGRLVGHVGTRLPPDGDPIADTIGGIVHPDYRGRGLTAAMGAHMVAGYAERGVMGARHLATGAHDRTQRLLVASGAIATGVLLGHVPATTEYRGIEHRFQQARIAVVVYSQIWGHVPPLDVYLPERYGFLAGLYAELGLERQVCPVPAEVASADWRADLSHDSSQGITVMRFGSLAGVDAAPMLEAIDAALATAAPVAYADLPLADPRTPSTVELLHDRGFCLAALLPGAATRETLRLQCVDVAAVHPDAIVTASPGGHDLLRRILDELPVVH